MSFLNDLQSTLAGPDPLQSALRRTIEELGAESGTIHLLGDDGALHLKASHGIPDVVLQLVQVVPVGKGMAGLAFQRMQPVNICNIQTDESGDVRPGAKLTGMEGAIVVPILKGARALGSLGVANHAARTFTEMEIETLIMAGRTIAAV